MRGLQGKVAIVTGATGEMGGTVADRLAEEGAILLCCGRNVERGEAVVARNQGRGSQAQFLRTDVGVEQDVRNAIDAALERFGRLDVVVNLAAATDLGRAGGLRIATEETNESFQSQLTINLLGPLWFYKYAIPEMQKSGGGNFINISTLSATKATKGLGAYAVSKAALESLSRQVAIDYGNSNIRSNCIALGGIRIAQSAPVHDHPAAGPALRQIQIIDRPGQPDDVASMVAFLASEESSFVTGEVFPLDGGAQVKMVSPDLKAIYKQGGN